MRITGGELRGRVVKVPPGEIRPTMDRMRESLFSILGPLHGLAFLDLFGGSGIVALEAVSRGAAPVVTVEKDRKKSRVLLQNLAIADDRIRARFMPAERYIRIDKGSTFDVVYIDPPFRYAFSSELLQNLATSGKLNFGARVLIHHPGVELEQPEGLRHADSRTYGGSHLDIFIADSHRPETSMSTVETTT